MEFKSSDFKWDTYDGETSGVFGNYDYEIGISARPTAKDIRWGSQDTNVRSWILEADGKVIEAGMADGLQACKKAAIEALNNHVSWEGE